jgi:hypothetical protein
MLLGTGVLDEIETQAVPSHDATLTIEFDTRLDRSAIDAARPRATRLALQLDAMVLRAEQDTEAVVRTTERKPLLLERCFAARGRRRGRMHVKSQWDAHHGRAVHAKARRRLPWARGRVSRTGRIARQFL